MARKIRIAIVGYGNLGRGVELAAAQNPDMELVGIFTRRDPRQITSTVPVYPLSQAESFQDKVDVAILCGGSATDLPEQGPLMARLFHTVDSYDNHAQIPAYFQKMDQVAQESGRVSIISTGWDPGLFSLNRLLFEAVLPQGQTYTFWGKGISQGHSDAIRRVKGVKDGRQYTVPSEEAIQKVRSGSQPVLATRDKHRRICYVVPEPGADLEQIERDIKTMPHYFADYETRVHFISEEELREHHSGMPHGGLVLRSGITGGHTTQMIEFGLKLDSNPEFTASVLVAYARAAARMAQKGEKGAKTPFDIPLAYLSPKSAEVLRKELL